MKHTDNKDSDTHSTVKGPRVTARSGSRNGFEAKGEEINQIHQTKREGKAYLYAWDKVCSHVHKKQGPCLSLSRGRTWRMVHQRDGETDASWVKTPFLAPLPQPQCGMSFMVAKNKAENSSPHKTHARTYQSNTRLWFLLAWFRWRCSFCHGAVRWKEVLLSTWSQEAAVADCSQSCIWLSCSPHGLQSTSSSAHGIS